MQTTKKFTSLKWLWLSVAIIALDQFTKWLITQHLVFGEMINITSFFALTLVYNQGAAFNFLSQSGAFALWLFGGIAIAASVLLIGWLYKTPTTRKWQCAALTLILGGAIGNLLDRITHGYVIDFLLFHIKQWSWPTFNVADSAICLGVAMLAIELLFFHRQK